MIEPPPTRLCRDCGLLDADPPVEGACCSACGSPRLIAHPELAELAIAHIDCDAYYASIEKRDRPELADRPLIVGGGKRGVVTTCCYIARRFGVRSAMPMGRALQLCPEAVVLRPDMEKYQRESRSVAELMRAVSPAVEQVSIDEAYLDLGARLASTEPPARALARLSLQIEKRIGITVSIGLAPNKMLAKLASDLGKPRGFRIIGRTDALEIIGPMKLSALPGVGPVMTGRLESHGLKQISDLWAASESDLIHRYGLWARRLMAFARAEDGRKVATSRGAAVSIAAETTFETDLTRFDDIDAIVNRLCEKLSARLDRANLAASGVTLKLRYAIDRHTITRACKLPHPTARHGLIWQAVRPVLRQEMQGQAFRLVGVTAIRLLPARMADPPDLFSALGS